MASEYTSPKDLLEFLTHHRRTELPDGVVYSPLPEPLPTHPRGWRALIRAVVALTVVSATLGWWIVWT